MHRVSAPGRLCYPFRVHHRCLVTTALTGAAVWLGMAASSIALAPGTDLVVPAAGRTDRWVTDLYLLNLGEGEAGVAIGWLVRGQPNPDPTFIHLTLGPRETRVLADVIGVEFGLERAGGAFRIVASQPILATCRIYATDGDATYGQGVEGMPTTSATVTGTLTHVLGLTVTEAFRTNIYALAGETGATLEVTLLAPSGLALASATLELGGWEPYLRPAGELLGIAGFEHGTLFVRIAAGSAVVGASRADNLSWDPTTLTSWRGIDDPLAAGTYYGEVASQDLATRGGLALRVDGEARVVGIEFSFPSDRCPVLFTAGQDLSDVPLPLADLAGGHQLVSTYPGGGTVAWTLTLVHDPAGPTMTGTLGATGSGWTGELAACNGDHEPAAVDVGVWKR